ncbi:MAG: hypothetical protein GX298_04075 [Planctomycetes bacterium]|jgi:hypothetical protein|nr:hypothetical protein [Planctomycetota bacterium]
MTTKDYIRTIKCHHWRRFDEKAWPWNPNEPAARNEYALNLIRDSIAFNSVHWLEDEQYA